MTVEAYKKRVEELKKKNVRCMHLDFRGQEPMEYIKIEVFEIEIDKESFRWNYDNIKDWNKNFIFDIGSLCGIEPQLDRFVSQKLSKYSYLSKSSLSRLTPSGNKEPGGAEYEFDAEIRGDETVLKDEVDNMNTPDKIKYKTSAQKKLVITQLAVLGRSKADTGSHKRGIIKMIKFPKPEKKLMGVHIFCFRCVPNMENTEVRQSYLESQNPSNIVYGLQRIEHKPDDIIQPAEQSGSVDNKDMDIEMCIDLTREELKENPAIYKLAGIILEKKFELEKFRIYIDSYAGLPGEKKISTLVDWIAKIEDVEQEFLNGSSNIQKMFLQNWGSK